MAKLTVIYEDEYYMIGKAADGQLYVGITLSTDSSELDIPAESCRVFQKIDSYSVNYNGDERIDSYVIDGLRVDLYRTSETASVVEV